MSRPIPPAAPRTSSTAGAGRGDVRDAPADPSASANGVDTGRSEVRDAQAGAIDSANANAHANANANANVNANVNGLDAPPRQPAALIGLDWGTTSLRAYLFDASGAVLATRASSAGIMNLPCAADQGGYDAAFDAICGAWLEGAPHLPVLAAGMVGSAQGWQEAPYIETPASAEALVAGILQVPTASGATLHVVPGVLERGELPNVMRGEETQVFGALACEPTGSSPQAEALIGLPGTHAKWVVVRAARIERFHTFMTGEVFAALSEHTILGRTMVTPDRPDHAAFLRGVSVAREQSHAGMLATIFSTRTLGLTAQLAREQQPDYLSGLLIGHELNGLEAVLRQQRTTLAGRSLRLIGSEPLCERYRIALAQYGCQQATIVGHATERGLWRIATEAGLVSPAAGAVSPVHAG